MSNEDVKEWSDDYLLILLFVELTVEEEHSSFAELYKHARIYSNTFRTY